MTTPLPEGFEIKPYLGGPALFLDGSVVVLAAELDNGNARLDMCVGTIRQQSRFITDARRAEGYMARWAVLWEAEIRALYSQRPGFGWYPGEVLNGSKGDP
ncbi:hypothetical protein [Stenotrophomonas tumulicola]|uniref:Uncharacterized protein n=1 Tax=Stenotrophomonas tumulicola TaxID=1685415 RepID=A0A7W3FJ61_9GAMM|nr:hypothetical protein [Stenotrophomonas tumulicola]MBA8680529.1 hypothetical protein [Stenotrophomonas tumulicola]